MPLRRLATGKVGGTFDVKEGKVVVAKARMRFGPGGRGGKLAVWRLVKGLSRLSRRMAGLLLVEVRSGFRGRYGTPPVRMGSAPRSRRGGKAFPFLGGWFKPENETIILVSDGEFIGVRVKTEALPIRVKIAVSNIKTAHDVAITIDFPSAHRIEIIKGDINIATAKGLVGPPEMRLGFE